MLAERYSRTFGVEEEYLLLDAIDGRPVDRAAELILAISEIAGQTEHEYFTSQIETATPVCRDASEAEEVLTRFRTIASREALARGVVIAGTGLPAIGGDVAGAVSPRRRYHLIESQMGKAAAHQYSTGMHVHVEVPSADAGIEVLARLARWAPALLAMTANSPLWCGEFTGFASWRHVMGLAWPVSGYPQGFENEQEYRRSVAHLIETGIVPDAGLLTWVARLSANYPTVELRIADAQLEACDAVAFAVIVRSLVDRALADWANGTARPQYAPALINGANWIAARNGLGSELIDPLSATSEPAFDLIDRMLGTIEVELDRFGDCVRVDRYMQRLREEGDPGCRQRSAFESAGISGLLELYRSAGIAAAAA